MYCGALVINVRVCTSEDSVVNLIGSVCEYAQVRAEIVHTGAGEPMEAVSWCCMRNAGEQTVY